MKTFKLHLIRHGITAGNLQGLYIGSGTDIPLCDEGRAQLADLKERFEYPQVDTVFSSPLMRAVETANSRVRWQRLPRVPTEKKSPNVAACWVRYLVSRGVVSVGAAIR